MNRPIHAAIVGLGATAVMTQLVLLRETMASFSGNELVLGVGLGCWLLLTGLGAWLVRHRGLTPPGRGEVIVALGMIAIALLPVLQVAAIRVLRDVVFLRGAAVGLDAVCGFVAVLMAPFCLLSGALLTVASAVGSAKVAERGAGAVYVADALGSVVGGVVFTFVLVRWFDHIALLAVAAWIDLGLAGWIGWKLRRRSVVALAGVATLGLLLSFAWVDPDDVTTSIQKRGRFVVWRGNSPYGRIVVTEDSGQVTVFENGVPAVASQDVGRAEEAVHYAMVQCPQPRRVLLIGGGISGTAREVLRHGVESVTYVELDPLVLEVGDRFFAQNLADPRIRTVADDGRRFVQRTDERFDVVIVDLPDPVTTQLNRFYTEDFMREVRRVLGPGGVIGMAVGRYENFVGPELADLLGTMHATLAEVFAHVQMIPGGRVFFIASDRPLTLDIAGRLEARGIKPRLVNRNYLDAMLTPDRLADLERVVRGRMVVNRDFDPVLYFLKTRLWLSQFPRHPWAVGACVLGGLGLLAFFVRIGPAARMVGAAGLTASVLEIVLLFGCQVLYGSVYQQVGLVVTAFMAGLAAGAGMANRWRDRFGLGRVRGLGLALTGLALAVAVGLPALRWIDGADGGVRVGLGLIVAISFAVAAVAGAQFAVAAGVEGKGTDPAKAAARLWAADLLGGAVGALAVTTIAIPTLGIAGVCLGTAGLNMLVVLVSFGRKGAP